MVQSATMSRNVASPPAPKAGLGEIALVTIAFIILAVAATWPLAAHLNERTLAGHGHNDVRFNIWVIHWGAHALLTDPLNLHHANIFHPEPWTFAYSDIELSHSLLMLPVIVLSDNPALVYDMLVLASLVIGGVGFYLFGRRLTGSRFAGFVSGVIYLYSPAHFGRYLQIQFFADHWLPWFLWSLLILLDRHATADKNGRPAGNIPWALATAAFFCLHALSGSHSAVFGTLLGLALVGWRLVRYSLWKNPRFWLDGAIAAAVAVIILAPVFYPYLVVEKRLAAGRVDSVEALRAGSADGHELLSAGSPFYRWLDETVGWPSDLFERAPRGFLFIGFVPLILAAAGLFRAGNGAAVNPAGWRRIPAWFLDACLIVVAWVAIVAALSGSTLLLTPFLRLSLPPALILAVAAVIVALLRFFLLGREPHLLVAVFTGMTRRVRPSGDQWLWLGVLVFSVWASLGPDAWLYQGLSGLPLIKLIRVPRRFMLVATVAVAVLAAWGAAALARRLAKPAARIALFSFLFIFFAVESVFAPLTLHELPRRIDVYHWLGEQPGDFAVIEFPVDPTGWAQHIRQVYGSIHHWKRLIVGYSGYQSPENVALLTRLNAGFPDDTCLDELANLDVRYVIVITGRLEEEQRAALARQDRLQAVKQYDGLVVYRLSGQPE